MTEFADAWPLEGRGGWNPEGEVPRVDIGNTVEANPAGGGASEGPAPDDEEGGWMITAPDEAGDVHPTQEAILGPSETTGDTLQPGWLDERTQLFDAPALSPEAVRERTQSWWKGETVQSEVPVVGHIEPTPEEAIALRNPELGDVPYDYIDHDSPLWTHIEELGSSFKKVVAADMERNGLTGSLIVGARFGSFGDDNIEWPHTDNYGPPAVRWTAGVGAGGLAGAASTIGYTGSISKADVDDLGNLRPGVYIGEQGQLTAVQSKDGAVLRFRGTGDMHASPFHTGVRVLLIATLRLSR